MIKPGKLDSQDILKCCLVTSFSFFLQNPPIPILTSQNNLVPSLSTSLSLSLPLCLRRVGPNTTLDQGLRIATF